MISYKYSALSKDGAKVKGVIDAIDEYTAVSRIKAEYPIVLKIEEVKTGGIWDLLNADVNTKKFDAKALSVMCSQFSIILSSGVAIDQALKMIAGQTVDKRLKKMLENSAVDVAQGTPLSVAFEKNYKNLPVLFTETIRAGELSGTLENSFKTLETYYDKSNKLQQKVKSAMSYPIFVVIVAIVVLIVIMGFVMPTFISMFTELGAEMPAITMVLIAMTNFFAKWWWLMLLILLLFIIGFNVWTHSENGKMKWAEFLIEAPIFGPLVQLQGSTEFAQTMSTLLEAGLGVGDALEVASKCMGNYAYSRQVHAMVEKVMTGHTLGEVMRENGFFPNVLKEMTAVGEETGELSKTLDTIGRYYSNEYDFAVNKFIARLEPTLLVFLAAFAGFIVIALYMPMFTMYNAM